MPKKVTLASLGALLLLAGLIAILVNAAPKAKISPFPERVCVYITDKNEIVTMDYDEFLEGCLRGFLPKNGRLYEQETMEALGVVINTNALFALENRYKQGEDKFSKLGADIVTGEEFPYIGKDEGELDKKARALVRTAAKRAKGVYLAVEGRPARLELCEISSGKTAALLPVMPSVELPSDALSYGYLSEAEFTEEEIVRELSEIKNLRLPPKEWFKNAVYDECGTLLSVELCTQKMTGEFIRKRLGLRSAAIEISYRGDYFVFSCKGCGNNVGMSLAAADAFSRGGKTAEEILGVFYNAEYIA